MKRAFHPSFVFGRPLAGLLNPPLIATKNNVYPGVSPTRLIAAWGDSATVSYHGTQLAKAEVVVFGGEENSDTNPLLEVTSTPGVQFFDITAVSGAMGGT